uniref:Uncharacterized protein n=1 Tax=Sphaerodactylus townsendi TaxID=933632 RepID=A0ACB8F008_9SAUR
MITCLKDEFVLPTQHFATCSFGCMGRASQRSLNWRCQGWELLHRKHMLYPKAMVRSHPSVDKQWPVFQICLLFPSISECLILSLGAAAVLLLMQIVTQRPQGCTTPQQNQKESSEFVAINWFHL